ncbi:MAG: diguanylate cyclase [Bacilli bacterium]|nr:diguanylate cyclase [Bacilli bacterium]
MKVLRIIRNYICYCGIEKEEYKSIKKNAYVSNFEVWRILHILMDVVFAGLSIYSLFSSLAELNKVFYIAAFIYSTLATIFFFVLKKDSLIGQLLIYLSISMLLLFACLITSNKPDVPAIAFVAFLLITPMFMLDKPYFMAIELIAASTIFLVLMYFVKELYTWHIDLVNTIIFTIVGIFLHIISSSARIREFILIKKINELKDIDELTGLKNKAALTSEINQFICADNKGKGLFIVLDIDFFKQINDTYGHDIGDVILKDLGDYLNNKFPKNAIVGRFGGDEFIVFIKDVNETAYASQIATEIYSEIADSIKLPNQDNLNVSLGVAIYKGQEKNYSEIFKKADIALYKTKANREKRFNISE